MTKGAQVAGERTSNVHKALRTTSSRQADEDRPLDDANLQWDASLSLQMMHTVVKVHFGSIEVSGRRRAMIASSCHAL